MIPPQWTGNPISLVHVSPEMPLFGIGGESCYQLPGCADLCGGCHKLKFVGERGTNANLSLELVR